MTLPPRLEQSPSDIEWLATIEGAPHLERRFKFPADATEGQARMRAWEICSWARGGTSDDPAQAVAAFGLIVRPVAQAACPAVKHRRAA